MAILQFAGDGGLGMGSSYGDEEGTLERTLECTSEAEATGPSV